MTYMDHVRGSAASLFWMAVALAVGAFVGIVVAFGNPAGIVSIVLVTGLLVTVVFWVMAPPRTVSDQGCRLALVAFIAATIIWPPYISVRVPGLPWITFARLFLVLTAVTFLYCILNSRPMRREIGEVVRANRLLMALLATYVFAQFMSVPFATNLEATLGRLVSAQVFWTFIFIVSIAVLRTEKQIMTMLLVIVVAGTVEAMIGIFEAITHKNVWLTYLPPGFTADVDYLERVLREQVRDGRYRARGSFTLPLTYGEFLVVILPLAIYLIVYNTSRALRVVGVITALIIAPAIIASNTRLGVIGGMVAIVAALGLATLRIWVRRREELIGPFLSLLFPLLPLMLLALLAFSPAFVNATFGGGSTQASTDARTAQWAMGIPLILSRPIFGRGVGNSGETLGFVNPVGIPTIDTWWLSLLLDVGIIGFVGFIGAFLAAIVTGTRIFLFEKDETMLISGALAATFAGFLIIKLVLSQADNHTLLFIMVAMMARLRMLQVARAAVAPVPDASAPAETIVSPALSPERMKLALSRRR